MEAPVPPAPPDERLAIVVIHGIGNQQPLDTLLPFAEHLIEEPAEEGEPKFWSKPDRLSESYELRRLTARRSNTRPTTDFFEYYWAHLAPDASYKQIFSWARRLLFKPPWHLIPKIRPYWAIIWVAILAGTGIYVYSLMQSEATLTKFLASGIGILGFTLFMYVVNFFAFKYVGDAARYLHPDPENIKVRHDIRTGGISLLRALHDATKGGQRYSRIVVVGHSLGSVIAYDILKHLWDEFNDAMECGPDSVLADLEKEGLALARSGRTSASESKLTDTRQNYRRLQRLFWRERYEAARREGKPAWLVSDLITMGSPLVHAAYLLDTKHSSFDDRILHRELPTCPPVPEKDGFSFEKWIRGRPSGRRVPHHAAVFISTVWTNLYFPGDIVGDRLAPLFGPGVEDIALTAAGARLQSRYSPAMHTRYWSLVKESTDHLASLRTLLGFDSTDPSMPESIPSALTKRDVLIGRQCRKALWLDYHSPELREPLSEGALLRMEQGNAVDRLAREVYAGGIEILETDWELACRTTRFQIEAGAKRLYQAAFEHEGVRIRTDILDILPDGSCTLREVKMSTKPKPEHLEDAAVQVFVLESNGLPVRTSNLVLIDTKYSAGSQASVFYEEDITEDVRLLVPEIEANIDTFETVLSSEEVPPIRIGAQCTRPSKCSFYDHCWKEIPKDSVFTIPRLSESKASQLLDMEVVRVIDVPDDFILTDNQREYVQLHKSGVVNIDRDRIKEMLLPLSKPLYFLDFETHSTPLPGWAGTRPYQQVPFQFSCHLLDHEDILKHRGYLHRSNEDPRPTLIEELLGWIGDEGTIMVYNAGFERRILQDLADGIPEHAARIHSLVERIFDQLDIVKAHIRHPGLLGSNSLKTVTEVLLPSEITYKGLEVADGESAQAAWNRMIQLPEEDLEKQRLAEALERYCLQDTLGQVALHRWCLE